MCQQPTDPRHDGCPVRPCDDCRRRQKAEVISFKIMGRIIEAAKSGRLDQKVSLFRRYNALEPIRSGASLITNIRQIPRRSRQARRH